MMLDRFLTRRAALLMAIAALTAGPSPTLAQMNHGAMESRAPPGCTTTTLECANAVTPFFDAHGTLWIVWTAAGVVSIARSQDAGQTFAPPVQIGSHGSMLDGGADARPQIVVDPAGHVVVAYGVFKDKRYNAEVMIATSDDGTRFTAPRSLSRDAASQRFPTLGFDPDGSLFLTWLDKRTVAAARAKGIEQPGAAMAYASSHDGGATFGLERIAADHTCECCHLGLAFDARHRPVVLFRAIYGTNIRDHAVTTFGADGAPGATFRVATDNWAIDGCPHHGPSLAITADGSYQAAWFTLGAARQGLFYARSTDAGRTFSSPQAVGDADHQAGRPQLIAHGNRVWLAWKEFDGHTISIKVRASRDAGVTWTADRVIGTTDAYADHPALVADANRVYVSWLTREHGYRLIAIEDP